MMQAQTSAIDVHSRQAREFSASYETYERDPYASCFTYSRMRLDQALARCLPRSGVGLLAVDVGCGTGHHMRDLATRGFEVRGVDGSADMLEEAAKVTPTAELQLADVDALPFADSIFDLALCIEVLRYLPDPQRCMTEMARVLRPGGVCLATAAPAFSANGYPLVNRLAVMLPVGDLVRLKQFFTTPAHLQRRFERAGFDDVDMHGVYTGPVNWVEHLAPRRISSFLRRWEGVDRRLSGRPMLRGASNMLLVRAELPS